MTDEMIVERLAGLMGRKSAGKDGSGRFLFREYYGEHEAMWNPRLWNPLTDWNHTMEVVERMMRFGFHYDISNGVHSEPAFCRFWNREKLRDETAYGTQQRAICLAALAAVSSSL